MPAVDYPKLRQLAALSPDDIGPSEEGVKINFIVPLLEALGHSRLRFEHRQRDIVLSQGLPRGMAILVETKRLAEPLDRHLDQLERYAYQERSLLAVITNGAEIRIYVPLWANAPSFAESLLLSVRRADLADLVAARRLAAVLGARALVSGTADRDIRSAQTRREQAWKHLAAVRTQAHRQREGLDARLRDLTGQAEKLDAEKRAVEGKLARLDASLERSLGTLRTLYGLREAAPPPTVATRLPLVEPAVATRGSRVPPQMKAATNEPFVATAGPGKPGTRHGLDAGRSKTPQWTDGDLTAKSTEYQRRIFATFVATGRRTLGTNEIADATGIAAHKAWGAISGFVSAAKAGKKEPIFEILVPPRLERERLGTLVTVVEEYWPTLCRLYADAPAAAPPPHSVPAPAPRPAPVAARGKSRKGRGHGWSKTLHWTDAELTANSTDYQQRILRAFVRAGERTLGLFEIAASAGLRSQQTWGALSSFISPVRVGRKEPLLEVTIPERVELERRGALITIAEKYWPLLCRLYAETANLANLRES